VSPEKYELGFYIPQDGILPIIRVFPSDLRTETLHALFMLAGVGQVQNCAAVQ
jgi:hypothetical protein